jgi:anti-sigma-K factor RskA
VNESLHALSGAYVVDALDDDERATFEAHLPGCLDCQREVASLREATTLLADESALAPPPALRSSVLAGIKNIRPLAPETGRHGAEDDEPASAESTEGESTKGESATVLPFRPRGSRMARMLVAAAAVVAIAGGAVYQPWNDNNPPSANLSAVDQVLSAADAQKVSLSFKDGSSATVYRSITKGKAVLLTDGMALPPNGKAYEVWLQDSKGTMLPAGMMKPQGDNKMLLEGDAAKATAVGITVEPQGGSKAPTTEPIALFDLGKGDA